MNAASRLTKQKWVLTECDGENLHIVTDTTGKLVNLNILEWVGTEVIALPSGARVHVPKAEQGRLPLAHLA